MPLFKIAILIVLLAIFAQDFRSRMVYWLFFPCLAILLVALNGLSHLATAVNLCFVFLIIGILSAYFSIKYGRWMNITINLLGWGDILFLLSVAFYLSVLNFLAFFLASLLAVLLCWPVYNMISKQEKHIPLAGLQALLFAFLLTTDWWIKPVNITSDDWLLHLIIK